LLGFDVTCADLSVLLSQSMQAFNQLRFYSQDDEEIRVIFASHFVPKARRAVGKRNGKNIPSSDGIHDIVNSYLANDHRICT
jgi:hypothetical protein